MLEIHLVQKETLHLFVIHVMFRSENREEFKQSKKEGSVFGALIAYSCTVYGVRIKGCV
jgi:hypothetical protein